VVNGLIMVCMPHRQLAQCIVCPSPVPSRDTLTTPTTSLPPSPHPSQANEERHRLQRTEEALRNALAAHEAARSELAVLQQKYAAQAQSLEQVKCIGEGGGGGRTAGRCGRRLIAGVA
jgi:hypothetical protein